MTPPIVDFSAVAERGASGCSNSDYAFVVTKCCGRVAIEDGELQTLFWDPLDLSHKLALYDASPCPLCGTSTWDFEAAPADIVLPEAWRWAAGSGPRGAPER